MANGDPPREAGGRPDIDEMWCSLPTQDLNALVSWLEALLEELGPRMMHDPAWSRRALELASRLIGGMRVLHESSQQGGPCPFCKP